MTNRHYLTIKQIKTDTSKNNKTFYKIFFNEITFTRTKEDGTKEEINKVHFVWPGTQAFELIKENQVTENMQVNVEIENDGEYHRVIRFSFPSKLDKTIIHDPQKITEY